MPQGGGGTFGSADPHDKDGRKKQRQHYDQADPTSEFATPQPAEAQRVATVQKHSTDQVPVLVKLALSGIDAHERDLIRAARLAAKKYDITPQMLFGKSIGQMVSPITGEEFTVQELRRLGGSRLGALQLLRYVESGVDQNNAVRQIQLGKGLTGDDLNAHLSDKKVTAIFDVVGKAFKDENLKATEGIALALQLAGDANPKVLAQNIDAVKRWVATGIDSSWKEQLGIAVGAAKEGVTLTDVNSVISYTAPITALGDAEKAQIKAAGNYSDKQIDDALKYAGDAQKATADGGVPPDLPPGVDLALVNSVNQTQGLRRNELIRNFEGDIDGYFKRAELVKDNIVFEQEAWENSWLNKFVLTPAMWTLDKTNRAFEIATLPVKEIAEANPVTGPGIALTTAISGGNPLDPAKFNAEQFVQDVAGAWHGEVRLADTLVRDWSISRWQAEGIEFIAGWYIDPLIVAGKAARVVSLKNVNPTVLTKLRVGLASESAMAKYVGRAEEFVDRNLAAFTRAMNATDTTDLIKWASKYRTVMGDTPFDMTFLQRVRDEMESRGILGSASQDDLKEVLMGHFLPAQPTPGSLLDTSFAARKAEVEAARKAYMNNIFDPERIIELGKTNAAVMAEEFVDPTNFMPRRLELPGNVRPIPGQGFVRTTGDAIGEAIGDNFIGRNLRKLPNINPGGVLKIHENPQQWFQRSARRAGWENSEVTRWEARAVEAAASDAPEQSLKSLLTEFQEETMFRFSRPQGVSDKAARELLDGLAGSGGSVADDPDRIFGVRNIVRNAEEGKPFTSPRYQPVGVREPIGETELVNFLPAVDPIQMRHAVTEYTGAVRKLRNAIIKSVPEQEKAAMRAINFQTWADGAIKYLGKPLIKVFKLGAVARPAYMFRVVLGDELMRALATNQSVFEQAMSYGWWTKALREAPDDAGALRRAADAVGTKIDDVGHRRIGDLDLDRPGSLIDEPLANTQLDVSELATATMKTTKRKIAALKATGDYDILAPTAKNHLPAWQNALNNTLRKSPILNEGMRAIAAGEVKSANALRAHLREWVKTPEGQAELKRIGRQAYEDEAWADEAADIAYGYTMGQPELARLAGLGEVDEALLAKFPLKMKLNNGEVFGRPYIHGPKLARFRDKLTKNWVDRWYGLWVRGPENMLNRQPYYKQFKQRAEAAYHQMLGGGADAVPAVVKQVELPADNFSDDLALAAARKQYPHLDFGSARVERIGKVAGTGTPGRVAFKVEIPGRAGGLSPAVLTAIDTASRDFALANSKRIMFDFTENSRYGELLSFAFPFVQPWQENIAVWGHILTRRNPAMIGYVNRVAQLGVETGFIRKDPETGEWVIPETWWMAAAPFLWMIGGHTKGGKGQNAYSLSTGLTSLNLFANSTFAVPSGQPGNQSWLQQALGGTPIPLPSTSPFAGYPLQQFFKDGAQEPGTFRSSLANYLFQFGDLGTNPQDAAYNALVPRWLRAFVEAAAPGLTSQENVNKIAAQYQNAQQYLGQPLDPERATNQARMQLLFDGMTALFFPGAVKHSYPHTYLETEYHDLIDENGGDMAKAAEAFSKKYPEYDFITIPKTTTNLIANMVDPSGNLYLNINGQVDPALKGLREPTTRYFQEIIQQPGFKEFANDPETAPWAIVFAFGSGSNAADEFDPAAWAKQMATGEVRYRTPQEREADRQIGEFWQVWHVRDSQYDSQFANIEEQGGYAGDNGPWDALARQKAFELQTFARAYPIVDQQFLTNRKGGGAMFSFDTDGAWPEGVHPFILHTIGKVLNSDVAAGFPATEALRDYWDYRNEVKDKLAAKGLDGLEAAGAEKLKAQFESYRNKLMADTPEVKVFMDTYFANDLKFGVQNAGEKQTTEWYLNRGEGENQTKYDQYIDFRTGYLAFSKDLDRGRADPETDRSLNSIYQERTAYVNRWYKQNPAIVQTWLDSLTAGERKEQTSSLVGRPPAFYSRLDWDLVGVKLNDKAAAWLQQVQDDTVRVENWEEKLDLTKSTGDRRAEIAAFISSHYGKGNKGFDTAIDAMNTWGYGATIRGWDEGDSRSAQAWRTLLKYANKYRVLAEEADIHGDAKTSYNLDPEDRTWYNNMRDNIGNYAKTLAKWDDTFKEQWAQLGEDTGDKVINWLVPDVWFKAGDTNPFGTGPAEGTPAGTAHVGGRKLKTEQGVTLAAKPLGSLEQAQKTLKLPQLFEHTSGYRTLAEQTAMYNNRANNPNPVAPPGQSNHEKGIAIDIDVSFLQAHPELGAWLSSHGWTNLAGDPPHWDYTG